MKTCLKLVILLIINILCFNKTSAQEHSDTTIQIKDQDFTINTVNSDSIITITIKYNGIKAFYPFFIECYLNGFNNIKSPCQFSINNKKIENLIENINGPQFLSIGLDSLKSYDVLQIKIPSKKDTSIDTHTILFSIFGKINNENVIWRKKSQI